MLDAYKYTLEKYECILYVQLIMFEFHSLATYVLFPQLPIGMAI